MKNIKPCPKINARWNKTLSTVQKQTKDDTTFQVNIYEICLHRKLAKTKPLKMDKFNHIRGNIFSLSKTINIQKYMPKCENICHTQNSPRLMLLIHKVSL